MIGGWWIAIMIRSDIGAWKEKRGQHQKTKTKTKTQIQKHKCKNTNARTQIEKYKCKNTNTKRQMQTQAKKRRLRGAAPGDWSNSSSSRHSVWRSKQQIFDQQILFVTNTNTPAADTQCEDPNNKSSINNYYSVDISFYNVLDATLTLLLLLLMVRCRCTQLLFNCGLIKVLQTNYLRNS